MPHPPLGKILLLQGSSPENLSDVGCGCGCDSLLVSGHCHVERRLPFLPTYGQELEKCVLGTEIIPLNGFRHEQMGQHRDHGLLGGAWTFLPLVL